MFYVAYFKSGAPARQPLTFYSTAAQFISYAAYGAFGPKRVVYDNDTHTPAAPYG